MSFAGQPMSSPSSACTQRGDLHPSTSPLAWPEVQPALLAVIGLLAIPAFVTRPRVDP